MAYRFAIEIHQDPDDVLAWPISKLIRLSEAFKRKGDAEKKAMEQAKRDAKVQTGGRRR